MPGKRAKRTNTDSLFPESDADSPQLSPPPELPKPWAKALSAEFGKPYFAELMRFVAAERAEYEVLPPEPDVYNAFRYTPLDEVRVVILGQDPYPTPGHAHGLCFSVRPGVALPGSLRNIYKELNADLGIPPAKHGYLAAWAKRGVFLLNTVLTVRAGKPASHAKKGWEAFTDAALQAVNELPRPVTLPCFIESLARPLELNATESFVSAQPAVGPRSPRTFLFVDSLVLSIAFAGIGSHLLELGEGRPGGTRSLKAEIAFPVEGELTQAAPFERIRFIQAFTTCGGCHDDEQPAPDVSFTEAFESRALRPVPDERVPLESLRAEQESCDAVREPERCALLDAVFSGAVVERDFAPNLATFY